MLQQVTKFSGVTFFWSYFDMGTNKSQTPQISKQPWRTWTGMYCVTGNYCQWFWPKNQPPSETWSLGTDPAAKGFRCFGLSRYLSIYLPTKLPVYLTIQYNTDNTSTHTLWRVSTLTFGSLNSIPLNEIPFHYTLSNLPLPVQVKSWISRGRLLQRSQLLRSSKHKVILNTRIQLIDIRLARQSEIYRNLVLEAVIIPRDQYL